MKLNSKKILTILIIVLIIISFGISSFAWSISDFNYSKTSVKGTENIKKFGNNAIKIITAIGVVASVVILIIIGLKYMIGSAEEKAAYKKTMLPYIIGCGIVFAASVIANTIYNWGKSL